MTTVLLVGIAGLLVGMLLVLIPMIFSLRKINRGVEKVERATNGLAEALVKATGEREFLKGVAQGTETEKARDKGPS